jgi:hypothetical protein
MAIGSFLWRMKNYGLRASLLHLLNKFSISRNENSKLVLSDLEILGLKVGVKDFFINVQATQKDLESTLNEIKIKLQNDNVKNVFEEPSFTRVLVLGALIQSMSFSQIIETGTQNGVSSILLSTLNKKHKANLKIHSFDVVNQPRIKDNDINYYVLDEPYRKNFCRITIGINRRNTVFFHDSDHSKENMKFEFDWAWNHLNVSALVSDDIESNNAFSDFCKRNNLSPLFFKFDNGPIVGLVLRD